MKVAARALESNLRTLGPLILPYSEQFKYAISLIRREWHKARTVRAAPVAAGATSTPDKSATSSSSAPTSTAAVAAATVVPSSPQAQLPALYVRDSTSA